MTEIKPYRAYLFDIDGTLLSCGDAAGRAAYGAMKEGFALAEVQPFPSFCGRTDRGILAELFSKEGIEDSEANRQKFIAGYSARLSALLPHGAGTSLPGVSEALAQLTAPARAKAPPLVTIMTGNCHAGARIKLEGYGLCGYFALERGGYGDDHHHRDDLARETFARLTQSVVNLKPDEILVIGDTVADITCAGAIGADCFAVASGSIAHSELLAAKPKYLAHSLAGVTWR